LLYLLSVAQREVRFINTWGKFMHCKNTQVPTLLYLLSGAERGGAIHNHLREIYPLQKFPSTNITVPYWSSEVRFLNTWGKVIQCKNIVVPSTVLVAERTLEGNLSTAKIPNYQHYCTVLIIRGAILEHLGESYTMQKYCCTFYCTCSWKNTWGKFIHCKNSQVPTVLYLTDQRCDSWTLGGKLYTAKIPK
jgi:hypothetical protein